MIMNQSKILMVLILLTTLTGCATAPKPPSETKGNIEESRDSFKRTDYVELQEDERLFNQALLEYEQDGRANNLSHKLRNAIKRSPKIAKYMMDKNLIRADENYAHYLYESALRTLIQSGGFTPYLDKYWSKVMQQPEPHWFKVEFATQASVFAADKLKHANSQKNLALYSMHACPTSDLARTRRITGSTPDDEKLFFGALNLCKEYPNEAAKWAGKYLTNKSATIEEKNALLDQMAEYYFNRKDYPHAAGYYRLLIENDDVSSLENTAKLVDVLELKSRIGAGMPIAMYLKDIQTNLKYQRSRNEKAIKRLKLIHGAGVQQFSDYGL